MRSAAPSFSVRVVAALLLTVAAPASGAQTVIGQASPSPGGSTTSPASPTAPAELPAGPPAGSTVPGGPPPPTLPLPTTPRQRLPGHYDEPAPRTRGTAADAPMTRDDLQSMHRRQLEAFDQADANRDGTLSPAEMSAYRAAMRRDGPPPPKRMPKPPDKGGPAQGVPNPRG